MARQFNLIPPVCEQAEYHLFQREKVEVQLPELYHKIGESSRKSSSPSERRLGLAAHRSDFPLLVFPCLTPPPPSPLTPR